MIGLIFEAFRAGVGAARAVMDGRHPVLVEDVLAAEGCSCSTPRAVIIHDKGTSCGDGQIEVVCDGRLGKGSVADIATVDASIEVLDVLAHEADRRDGVRRGPR